MPDQNKRKQKTTLRRRPSCIVIFHSHAHTHLPLFRQTRYPRPPIPAGVSAHISTFFGLLRRALLVTPAVEHPRELLRANLPVRRDDARADHRVLLVDVLPAGKDWSPVTCVTWRRKLNTKKNKPPPVYVSWHSLPSISSCSLLACCLLVPTAVAAAALQHYNTAETTTP